MVVRASTGDRMLAGPAEAETEAACQFSNDHGASRIQNREPSRAVGCGQDTDGRLRIAAIDIQLATRLADP